MQIRMIRNSTQTHRYERVDESEGGSECGRSILE